MVPIQTVATAVANLVLLVAIPFSCYAVYQGWRKKRGLGEILSRAGLKLGEPRYLVHAAVFAAVSVGGLLLWSPSVEPLVREGSPQHDFAGLGLGGPAIAMALIYGLVTTGFSEEVLFRGLIAGSLARRLPLLWANLIQGLIFLAPHLFILAVMPELWMVLPFVFVGALVLGWVRIKSDSIVGPWLIHGSANVATCLMVAVKTAA